MRKYKRIGVIILVILNRTRMASKHIRSIVLDNKGDYDAIANLYYEDYQKHNTSELIYVGGKSGKIYCLTYDYNITLSDSEYISYQNVYGSFNLDGKSLEFVCTYETFVSFCTVNGRASIVYSANDEKPSYITSPNEEKKKVAVRKIADRWYYVYDNGWS